MTATALAPKPINLDDFLTFSVGGNDFDFHGHYGLARGETVGLDTLADNIDFLTRMAGGDQIRWLMLTNEVAALPHDRKWKIAAMICEVENIGMGTKAVRDHALDPTGFIGKVDYVLLHLLKTRQMCVIACFDEEDDAILAKMRG
jgi:hypothetical protein